MELRHLRYFKIVAELLNFSRAAEVLHVAQPALSRQIKALEDELGATLLDRNRVRVQLTDAGRTFYAQTCKILAQVDMAVAAVQEVNEGTGGQLIICPDWHLAGEIVPASLAEFRSRYPRAEVVLQERKHHDQLTLLTQRRVHLGFLVREMFGRRRDLQSLLMHRSRLLVVLPQDHRLAGEKLICLADLANETWITIDEQDSPDYSYYLTRICRLSGFTPIFSPHATNTLEGLIGRVGSGYGITLLPESVAPTHLERVVLIPTDCDPIEYCAVWHKQDESKLLRQYLDILREHVARVTPVSGK